MTPIFAMNPHTADPASFAVHSSASKTSSDEKSSAVGTPSAPVKPSNTKTQSISGAAKNLPKIQDSKNNDQKTSIKPAIDEYLPEEKQEPSGRYWIQTGENGHSQIYFDNAEPASAAEKKNTDNPNTDSPDANRPKADRPDANHPKADDSDKKNNADKITGSTDKVDREIRKLKQKKKQLEQQCNSETDEQKIKDLQRELSKVENELRQKDNDSYRRRNTIFS